MSADTDSIGDLRAAAAQAREGAGWRVALPVCVLALVALLLIHADTIAGLFTTWNEDSSYGHALLVVPLCIWLIWRDRTRLAALRPAPQWLALLLMPIGAAGWFAADLIAVRVGRELALYLLFVLVVWVTLGWRVLWVLAFPLAYLSVVIPVWSVFVPPLQDWTAVASARSLQFFGVPVYLEGHYMHIPNGLFIVEEVCAGLRFLLATMAIVALHARLSLCSAFNGVLLFVFAVLMAIVFNWIRVDIIVAAGHLFGMQHWLVHNHIEFGWIMFLVALLPVIAVSRWLQHREDTHPPRPVELPADHRAGVPATAFIAAACAGLAVAAMGPGMSMALGAAVPEVYAVEFPAMPALPGSEGPHAPALDLGSRFGGVDRLLAADYETDGGRVSVQVAFYAFQSEGKEIINDRNSLYDPGAWTSNGAFVVATGADAGALPPQVIETLVRSRTGESRLLWYWYDIAGHLTVSAFGAKFLPLLDLPGLLGQPAGAAAIAISTPAGSTDTVAARATLARFAAGALAPLRQLVVDAEVKY